MASPSKTERQLIALISGGKDSLFSILHCLQNGWTVVALGNLEPKIECNPSSSTSQPKALQSEDIESHLYQTIGHDSIPVFNYVLGIPLYRAQILGSRVDPSRTYRSPYPQREQDETEDLRRLLILILQQHPEAKYICTGAILSDYQRTRVENVCNQLGLTSVAPLWQYPGLPISRPGSAEKYAGLLQDMQTTGMEARIIKTASAGLSLDNLWEDVCSTKVRKRLLRSMSKYVSGDDLEAAVIGEGGEYETLCVNGPPIVWRGRLVFDDDAFQPVRGEAGSAHLRVPRPRIEWHSPEQSVAPPSPTIPRDVPSLPIPQLFDAGTWIAYQTALNSSSAGEQVHPSEAARKIGNLQLERDDLTKVHKPVNSAADSIDKCRLPSRIILQCRDTLLISNLTEEAKDIAEQSTGIFQTLLRLLYDHGLSVHHLTQLVICLRSMQHFAAINAVYSRFFGHTDPPTRVTTACGAILPLGCELIVHASASFADPALHHALYVRSISYWAPANIAPYSQAIKLAPRLGKSGLNEDGPSMLAVPTSGQIPLVPMTMNLPTLAEMFPYLSSGGEIGFRIALAAQHLWRVGQVMKVKWWTDAVAFIAAGEEPSVNSSRSVAKHVSIATKFWLERCRLDHPVFEEDSPTEDEGADPELQRQQLDWSLVEHETKDDPSACVQAIPFFTVEVQALPRGVSVEFHATGYLLNPQVSSESVSRRPIYIRSVLDHRIQVPGLACQLSVDLVMTEIQGLRVSAQGTATVAGPAAAEFPVADLAGYILAILNAADDSDPRRRSVWKPSLMTLYAVSLGLDEVEEPVTGHRAQPRCPIRWMPVKRVFDKQRRLCDFGFVLKLEEAASIGTPA